MTKVLFVALLICLALSPFARCALRNIHFEIYYFIIDLIQKIKNRNDLEFNLYGVEMFIGMFGHGKTLSMTHKATKIYKHYGDRVRFISNYELKNIPYIPLINFEQLVDLGDDDSDYIGNVVLIDEISSVLNNRAFAKFPMDLLSLLMQQRKRRVFIMCTAQRQKMVDIIFRNITTYDIDCRKFWRFCNLRYYDAWDYENAPNIQVLKPIRNYWWFVRNSDFEAYDTSQMISRSMCADFISNDEAIVRAGLETSVSAEKLNKKHLRRAKNERRKHS